MIENMFKFRVNRKKPNVVNRASLLRTENPYGRLGTASKIHKIVRELELEGLLKKTFFQVNRIEA